MWEGSPDPATTEPTEGDWYFYWARVPAGRFDASRVRTGTTIRTPLFTGTSPIPEFENVRLDAAGRMPIGASAYKTDETGTRASWAIHYQRQR